MNQRSSSSGHGEYSLFQPPNTILTEQALNRRRSEMQRRFVSLQIRRNHLENELQAINTCLTSLDLQIQKDNDYKKLSNII